MTIQITDEMPDQWVRDLADTLEARGHDIHDAHESAIVITLTNTTHAALDACEYDKYLIVSWAPHATYWGVSADGVWTHEQHPLGGTTPAAIAERAHRVLTCGRPEPRNLRHAIPYAAASDSCTCVRAIPCGGIVPTADCPDHGARKEPAMEWHWETDCHQSAL